MIYTDMEKLNRYLGMEKNLDTAFHYLMEKGKRDAGTDKIGMLYRRI